MESLELYKNLNDSGKMDLLAGFHEEPSMEFINYLEGELFSVDADEFLRIEIWKFLSRFSHANRETKDKIVKMIVESHLDGDEMVASIGAQELMFFDLARDDFERIFNLLSNDVYQKMDMADLSASLIRLLCTRKNRDNGSLEFLHELENMDLYRDSIKAWTT